jgi:acetylornithine deacetylase
MCRGAAIPARYGVPGRPAVESSTFVRDDVIELTSQLVAIDSINPSLVPGGAGEGEIAAFVSAWSRAAGLDVQVLERTRGRPSVVARARGKGGGATLLLCAHLDTVGTDGMTDPLLPRLAGGRLYGRGAYDMKASLAASLLAGREIARAGLRGDVVIAAVADEEHSSIGVQEILESVTADAAIVTEPTALEIVVAHKGFVWIEIEVTGVAAHGSRPESGVDAIVKAGPLLTALGELDESLGDRMHPLLGRGSVHASLIAGGAELSSYPARCVISHERRTLPGETQGSVEAEIGALLGRCRSADAALTATQRTLLVREPFEVPEEADVVQALRASAETVLSATPLASGAPYWADAAFLAAAGIPTVMFGPGGDGAHAVEEWVSIPDAERLVRVLVDVAGRLAA